MSNVKISKKLKYMCPRCYSLVCSATNHIDINFETSSSQDGKLQCYSDSYSCSIYGKCPSCGEFSDDFIELDDEIAEIIRDLNIKGWKTKFCCAGHPYSTDVYIYFDNKLLYSRYLVSLPKGFRVDTSMLSRYKNLIIRSEYGNYNIEDLRNWVDNLPKIPEIKSGENFELTEEEFINFVSKFDK